MTPSTVSKLDVPTPPDDVSQAGVRVAHIHSSLGLYGSDRWTLTLIKHHDRRRVATVLVTLGDKPGGDHLTRFNRIDGLQACHIGGRGKLNLAMIRQLRDLIVDAQIDVVHTHGFKSDVIAFLACVGLRVKLVSTVHGWCAHEGWRIRCYEAIGRIFLRGFDRIYPVSPAQYDELVGRHRFSARRVRLMLNAVDTAAFEDCFVRRRMRSDGDPFRVLFAGRLTQAKGLLDLIEAFAAARIVPEPTLCIAGEGPDGAAAQARCVARGVASRVKFLGALADIRSAYEGSDVIVLPSYSEGIPRVLMEASAAGLPVIGSDIPGIRQLIEPERTGLLVPAGDPLALAGALERIAREPRLAHEMALQARALVKQRFAAERLSREFEDEYDDLLSGTMAAVAAARL